jgi:hypothetical protein
MSLSGDGRASAAMPSLDQALVYAWPFVASLRPQKNHACCGTALVPVVHLAQASQVAVLPRAAAVRGVHWEMDDEL